MSTLHDTSSEGFTPSAARQLADIPHFQNDVPANEHVIMQIASQIFGIAVPPNAVIRFADGELAYIVKRFDRRNGQKIGQEDFSLPDQGPDCAGDV